MRHVVGDVDGKMAIELRNVEVCPECKTTGIVEFVKNGQSTWECTRKHKFKKPIYVTVIKELKEQE